MITSSITTDTADVGLFPDLVVENILKNLLFVDWLICEQVCRQWRAIVVDRLISKINELNSDQLGFFTTEPSQKGVVAERIWKIVEHRIDFSKIESVILKGKSTIARATAITNENCSNLEIPFEFFLKLFDSAPSPQIKHLCLKDVCVMVDESHTREFDSFKFMISWNVDLMSYFNKYFHIIDFPVPVDIERLQLIRCQVRLRDQHHLEHPPEEQQQQSYSSSAGEEATTSTSSTSSSSPPKQPSKVLMLSLSPPFYIREQNHDNTGPSLCFTQLRSFLFEPKFAAVVNLHSYFNFNITPFCLFAILMNAIPEKLTEISLRRLFGDAGYATFTLLFPALNLKFLHTLDLTECKGLENKHLVELLNFRRVLLRGEDGGGGGGESSSGLMTTTPPFLKIYCRNTKVDLDALVDEFDCKREMVEVYAEITSETMSANCLLSDRFWNVEEF